MRARAIAGLLCLTLLGGPRLTWAADFPQNPHIGAAQRSLDAGQLDEASKDLQQALAQPDNSDDALVEIYRLQAFVALYKGNRPEARRALEKLFQANPDYELPKGAPPKIRDLFHEVQADVRAHRVKPVTLEFEPPGALAAGGPATIQASVKDLPSGARVRFFYRRVGSEAYSALELKPSNGTFAAVLPAAELPVADAPFALEYYLEVDDTAGRRLAGRGDALAPLTVHVRAPATAEIGPTSPPPEVEEESAWYQKWYVWTAIGVGAAAAGGATYYFLSRPKTGTLPLTVTFQ